MSRYVNRVLTLSLIFSVLSALQADVTSDSLHGEIKLRTYVESENVPLNREVIYHIELSWPGDLNRYTISESLQPTISNLSMRGSGSSNKVIPASDGSLISVKKITYYFRPLEMGMAYIDGTTIRYQDNLNPRQASLSASRIAVKITEPIQDESGTSFLSSWFTFLLIIIICAAALYMIVIYYRRRKEDKHRQLSEIKETVEEKYLRLLRETIHFNTDNISDSLNDLNHLVNGYFSERFHIPAASIPEQDLLAALTEKNLEEEALSRVKEFYHKANLVKFAAESVEEAEFHRLYDTIELMLENQNKKNKEEDE